MSALDAFYTAWSQARTTYGAGAPRSGEEFESSAGSTATVKRRAVIVVCCLASLATGCTRDSSAAPPPTPTDVGPAVVSVEDVRSISGVGGFHEVPELNATAPATVPDTPDACRAVFDPPTVFGTGWKRFRAAGYTTLLDTPILPTIADVRQEVAVYPGLETAQTAFDRLATALPGCTSTGNGYYRRSVEAPDPNTLLLNSEEADGAYDAYRLTGTTLINSSALGLPDSERVALEVLDRLEDAQH